MTPVDYLIHVAHALPEDWRETHPDQPHDELHELFNEGTLAIGDELDPLLVDERLSVGFDMLEMACIGH